MTGTLLEFPLSAAEATKLTVSTLFSFILIVALVALLVMGDKNDSLKKVLGGFGVFLFAIISDSSWVLLPALFIGGLLIASEKFLLILASIFRAQSADIARIVDGFEPLTEKEISERQSKEAKKNVSVSEEKKTTPTKTVVDPKIEDAAEKVKFAEAVALNQIRRLRPKGLSSTEYAFKEYVKVNDGGIEKAYDGVFVRNNTNEILFAFEVKFFEKMDVSIFKQFLSEAKAILSKKFITYFYIVFGSYDHEKCTEILELRKVFIAENPDAKMPIYQQSKTKYSLEPINTEDID